jgi:molybdopterin/thiamine biosynthesis adenylyltransferase
MFDGQVTTLVSEGPRFADLYPSDPDAEDLPSCEVVGVLGAVTGVIGTLMAMEAIKLITGLGEPLVGRLLLYDGRSARFTELTYGRAGGESRA